MHLFITGGTGLIGRSLCQRLRYLNHNLTVLTRQPQQAQQILGENFHYISSLASMTSLDGFDAVVNLAGEPITNKRWNRHQKQLLCHSRWEITAHLTRLVQNSILPPKVFISGSAVGYYGDQAAALVIEEQPPSPGFTHTLCARWEELAQQASSEHTRVCLLRTGIVLAAEGGVLKKMLPLFRLGLGGKIGNGHQYMPWIHLDDMVNGILYLLESPTLSGPFNMTAPCPLHHNQFVSILGKILHRPTYSYLPSWLLRIFMGESSILLLEGQRAMPYKLEQAGFSFQFPELRQALKDLLNDSSSHR